MWTLIAAWFCTAVFLFAKLAMYSQSPGAQATPPLAAVANIHPNPDRYTLVVSVHPKCPCTQSTFYELERLVPKVDNNIDFVFYIFTTQESPESWFNDSSAHIQTRFPDSVIHKDIDAVSATRIGSMISGSTVLYNPDGYPVFWGGVTSGRGHSGDNLGSDSIIAIVNDREPPRTTTLVYGCEITQPNSNHLFGTCNSTDPFVCEKPREESTQ